MIAPLVVLAIAGADIVGWVIKRLLPKRTGLAALLIGLGMWALVAGALTLALGGRVVGAVLVVVAAVTWPLVTSLWPLAPLGYLAVVAALAVWLPAAPPAWSSNANGALLESSVAWMPSLAQTVAMIAVTAFLGLSANLVCRGALERARVVDAPALVTAHREQPAVPSLSVRMRMALDQRWAPVPVRPAEMRGGRLIGPLERWLIVSLALVGAQGIIAALMAAKGIVRFPEISKNSGEGSKAEEFLIGSLISWGLAGAGAALIAVSA